MQCVYCDRPAIVRIMDVATRSEFHYCEQHAMESGDIPDPFAEILHISEYSVRQLTNFVRIHRRRPTRDEIANLKQDDERMDRVEAAADFLHHMLSAPA